MSSNPSPNATDTTACEKVFGTVELLENVLSYLPEIDTICSKRVCRTFRDTYNGSKKLQEAIFGPEPEECWKYDHGHGLGHGFHLPPPNVFYRQNAAGGASVDVPYQWPTVAGVVLSPILCEQSNVVRFRGHRNGSGIGGYLRLDLRKLHSQHSCNNIPLTCPAVKSASLLRCGRTDVSVSGVNGITIGTLLGLLDVIDDPGDIVLSVRDVKVVHKVVMEQIREMGYYRGFDFLQAFGRSATLSARLADFLSTPDLANLTATHSSLHTDFSHELRKRRSATA